MCCPGPESCKCEPAPGMPDSRSGTASGGLNRDEKMAWHSSHTGLTCLGELGACQGMVHQCHKAAKISRWAARYVL